MNVARAVEVFGSVVRVRLIRHYLDQPGTQTEAANALGVTTGAISYNIRALVDLGVLVEQPAADLRTRHYSVDLARVSALHSELAKYFNAPAQK